MSTAVKSKSSGSGLKAAGAALLILAGIWFLADRGIIGGGGDPFEPGGAPEQEPRLVILTAAWGHFEDTGETWEDGEPRSKFVNDDREMTITFWVDGILYPAVRDEQVGSPWTEYLALHEGAEVRLLVEQHGTGGFLMCSISANGKILLPNGYMHRNDAGDCDVTGVVE